MGIDYSITQTCIAYQVVALVSRAQFLRGDFSGRERPLRPPWALTEVRFTDTCTRCGECLDACPEHLLLTGAGGFPIIDFRRGECDFCAACVDACKPLALRRLADDQPPWKLQIDISKQCLAQQGIECRICGEQCEQNVLSFRLRVAGVAEPQIDPLGCNGCGACIRPCPVNAISLNHREENEGVAR